MKEFDEMVAKLKDKLDDLERELFKDWSPWKATGCSGGVIILGCSNITLNNITVSNPRAHHVVFSSVSGT